MTSAEVELMNEERRRIPFNVEEITNVLDGGPEKTHLRRMTTERIQNDPIAGDLDWFYKSEEEMLINGLKRAFRMREMNFDQNDDTVQRTITVATSNSLPLTIHNVAFIPTLIHAGSADQIKKWLPLASDYKIIGSYAQTELGHGTFLRGSETTATYIPETQEFEVDSPKLTAMKWWPGDLAKCANHVIIMANLIIDDQIYGVHPFIIQIRDLNTHEPLPGVTVGDIGGKFGLDRTDNGFLYLDRVRIPRENMLAGIAEVDRSGNYSVKGDPKLFSGKMLLLRVRLIDTSATFPLQLSCTIATRYSLMRRQGSVKPGGPEVPVLDYITQQRKILPLIALSYAFHFSIREVQKYHSDVVKQMGKGEYSNLSELHAITAGMKPFVTDYCLAGTDVCRRSCGGHGYLEASGFLKIFLIQMASVTYNGENTVMYLQCARYLMKCASIHHSGKIVSGFANYLNDDLTGVCRVTGTDSFMKLDVLLQCFRHRANRMVQAAYDKLTNLKGSGMPYNEAWNLASVDLEKTSEAHVSVYVMSAFMRAIRKLSRVSNQSKLVLQNLCSLWGIHYLNNNIGSLLVDGYINNQQAAELAEAELSCLRVVREYALGLVDAYDFTDKTLQSCLGAYDGNVYERLYENARRSPRNDTEVHEGFYKIFKHVLRQGRDILQKRKSKL